MPWLLLALRAKDPTKRVLREMIQMKAVMMRTVTLPRRSQAAAARSSLLLLMPRSQAAVAKAKASLLLLMPRRTITREAVLCQLPLKSHLLKAQPKILMVRYQSRWAPLRATAGMKTLIRTSTSLLSKTTRTLPSVVATDASIRGSAASTATHTPLIQIEASVLPPTTVPVAP